MRHRKLDAPYRLIIRNFKTSAGTEATMLGVPGKPGDIATVAPVGGFGGEPENGCSSPPGAWGGATIRTRFPAEMVTPLALSQPVGQRLGTLSSASLAKSCCLRRPAGRDSRPARETTPRHAHRHRGIGIRSIANVPAFRGIRRLGSPGDHGPERSTGDELQTLAGRRRDRT